MKLIQRISYVSVLAATVFMLSACSPSASASQDYQDQPQACINNPFLQKYDCSLKRVEQAAERSEPDAEYALGYMYYYGIGTSQDTQTATVWIKRAAQQGQPLAIKALKLIEKQQYPSMGGVSEAKPVSHHVAHHAAAKTEHHADLAAVPGSHYTIQLIGSHSAAGVKAFVARHHLSQAKLYHTTFRGKPWTIAVYGDYASKEAARAAIAHLPASVQALHPWVKSYAAVHKDLR